MKIVTLGADPEFFVFDRKGRPYPAVKFARGTKESPISIGDGFFEQRDNISFEGNIPPATTKEQFIHNVSFLRNYFAQKVEKFGYSLSPNGVEYFDKRYLELAEAKEFGCSEVVSAWDSNYDYTQTRPTPVLSHVKYRVSGFHIHIGYKNEGLFGPYYDNKLAILVGRLFDIFLTIPSHKIKPEIERLESYGAAGMIRIKPYGVECRTLSTFFTQDKYLPWVWDQIMKIEEFINKSNDIDLKYLIRRSHFIPTHHPERPITELLYGLNNKEILKDFNETKQFYEEYKTDAYKTKTNFDRGRSSHTIASWSISGTTSTF